MTLIAASGSNISCNKSIINTALIQLSTSAAFNSFSFSNSSLKAAEVDNWIKVVYFHITLEYIFHTTLVYFLIIIFSFRFVFFVRFIPVMLEYLYSLN
jgi:hypothetical protein